MALVLYRKYRPKTFSEIVGQEHVVETLKNAILSERVGHAYLFYGPKGTGKTTIARLLAKAVNCYKVQSSSPPKTYEPCNQCVSCVEINESRSMDLIEIDAASNRGIDEIRNLKEGINLVPSKSKYKVYIIDECHELTREASNALLKTLEEPPPHVIFVLCTTEYDKVLPTIASRCQRFQFKKLSLAQIVKRLSYLCEKENVKAEKPALELIARSAEGSIRDAESLLNEMINLEDEVITTEEVKALLGIVGTEPIMKILELMIKKDKKEAINFLLELFEKGMSPDSFCKKIIEYLSNLLLVKISPQLIEEKFTEEEKEALKKQGQDLSIVQLKEIIKIFLEAQNQIRWSENSQIPLELAVVEAIDKIKILEKQGKK